MRHLLFVAILFSACSGSDTAKPAATTATVVITNDTIPALRTEVKKQPVASLSVPVNDALNDWQFAVNVYETRNRFRFRLNMQYKELRVTDSMDIPNVGIEPTVQLKKGPETYSCIIGFLDKKGVFKEYKKAYVKNEQFKFTTLNHYYVGSYKTPQRKP